MLRILISSIFIGKIAANILKCSSRFFCVDFAHILSMYSLNQFSRCIKIPFIHFSCIFVLNPPPFSSRHLNFYIISLSKKNHFQKKSREMFRLPEFSVHVRRSVRAVNMNNKRRPHNCRIIK